ncbi:MAG: hypothetical protein VKJ24_04665 [Synechococcales bacterium]|nr:hypothetical protein [Synechococcales bacterium]
MPDLNPDTLADFLFTTLPHTLGIPWYIAASWMGLLHMAIGTIAALIAQRKGRNLKNWLAIGWIAGTPAVIYALWLKIEE